MTPHTRLHTTRTRWMVTLPAAALVLAAIAALGGCPRLLELLNDSGGTSLTPGLEKFSSAQDMEQYLRNQYRWQHDGYGSAAPRGGIGLGLFGLAMAAEADTATGGDTQNDGYSTTNLQETGVDEGDIVKNDDTYLYVVRTPQPEYTPLFVVFDGEAPSVAEAEVGVGGDGSDSQDSELRIVRAVPAAEMAVASRLPLPGAVHELYLRGDTLVALATQWDQRDQTRVTIIDVSDRQNPTIVKTIVVEGTLTTSRLIDERLHVVVQLYPNVREVLETDVASDAVGDKDDAEQAVTALDVMIPDLTVVVGDGSQATANVVDWTDVYRPLSPAGCMMTVVLTIDVDDASQPLKKTAIVGYTETVYCAPEALYLARTGFDYNGTQSVERTLISKLALRDEGAVHVGSGEVPGWLLNRYSLSEHQGYLRVATTSGQAWLGGRQVSGNNVYVLGPGENELVITGQVTGLAPGEQIYAARFLGDRGFLVTYERVDPLFTLELSDPANPTVVGQLKVPGYSDYLHPLGENHLLAIGKETLDDGSIAWYQGVQLSVFDVTDFANPTRLDVETIGDRGTESQALHDPHAFNYYEPSEMLAIPINLIEGGSDDPWSYGTPTFDGLYLYQVNTTDGITYLGRVPLRDVSGAPYCCAWNDAWTRGVFIGDYVYAVAENLVRAVPQVDVNATPIDLPLE